MANLVAPVQRLTPYEERIIEFKGLNRKSSVEEGELSDMQNLTSSNYPLLTPRKLRGELTLPEGVAKPLKIMVKYERIAMIAKKTDDTVAFFYDGEEVTSVTGLSEATEMVAINSKICFFPEKTYLSIERGSESVTIHEYGQLGASQEVISAAVTISNIDARITMQEGHGFAKGDAIDVTGTLTYTPAGGTPTTRECVVSCNINNVDGNVLVLPRETFIEMTGAGATAITLTGTVKRDIPDLVHVIEWNNRLWGANSSDNSIYACKLGDPTNWKYYQGTSLDSYYAQQGTDENWTGSAAYSGHLIFFKPNSMTKIYGTSPSSFQITNTVCYGVEEGSSNSVTIVNDKVFYKSSIGIMVYEGGTPYGISDKFNSQFKNVVGGTEGRKYYASCETADGEYELMVLDIDKAVWHKEDSVRFRDCCTLDGRMYFIEDVASGVFEADHIYIVNSETATEKNSKRKWTAQFGPFDEYIENQKIYSKMSLRFIAQPGCKATVFIKMDDGEWEIVRRLEYVETGGVTVPIVPRRCDRFSIKISGIGDFELKSMTRRFRRGSGVKP